MYFPRILIVGFLHTRHTASFSTNMKRVSDATPKIKVPMTLGASTRGLPIQEIHRPGSANRKP